MTGERYMAGDGATTPKRGLPRRGLLKVLAATAGLPLGILALRQLAGAPPPVQWHGETLGAKASLTLWHPDPGVARRTIARMQGELDRLERVFSLYRADSEIARLNHSGRLTTPSRDLLDVLAESRRIAAASDGAFDPTIQPLWRLYARHSALAGRPGGKPSADMAAELASARALIDFTAMRAGPRAIAFDRPGMAISLNGIAQGHVTDRITDLLRNEGFEHAMVELGETFALGTAPDGGPHEIALINPARPGLADRTVGLADAALAVSGGYGLRFDLPDTHHIFDPATGHSANRLLDVAVVAPRAVWADALSTAIYVAGEAAAPAILQDYPGARAMITRNDGSRVALPAAEG
jgi:FAD:protein FMN transferase